MVTNVFKYLLFERDKVAQPFRTPTVRKEHGHEALSNTCFLKETRSHSTSGYLLFESDMVQITCYLKRTWSHSTSGYLFEKAYLHHVAWKAMWVTCTVRTHRV
jgi:hypothetical protein